MLDHTAENGKSGFNLLNSIRPIKGLRPIEKLLLLELAFHKNKETGRCNPGYKRLAAMLDLSVSAVRRAIRALEEKGLIRKTPGFAKVSSEYEFILEEGSVTTGTLPLSPEGGGVSLGDHSQCHQETTPSVTTGTEGVSPGEHQTVLEQRKEQSLELTPDTNIVSHKGKAKTKAGAVLEPEVLSVGDTLSAEQGGHYDVTSPSPGAEKSPKEKREALLARQDEAEFREWEEQANQARRKTA